MGRHEVQKGGVWGLARMGETNITCEPCRGEWLKKSGGSWSGKGNTVDFKPG